VESAPEAGLDAPSKYAPVARAPLIPGEYSESYEELHRRFVATLKPADVLEEIWVREAAELAWEIQRLRRIKANMLSGCASEGLEQVLHSIDADDPIGTAYGWAARDPQAIRRVDAALSTAGFSIDTIMARTYLERLVEMDRIERIATALEIRRNETLQQIRRHRAPFTERMRRSVADAEVAGLKLIAPEQTPATAGS
jgi:hypothetical protein